MEMMAGPDDAHPIHEKESDLDQQLALQLASEWAEEDSIQQGSGSFQYNNQQASMTYTHKPWAAGDSKPHVSPKLTLHTKISLLVGQFTDLRITRDGTVKAASSSYWSLLGLKSLQWLQK